MTATDDAQQKPPDDAQQKPPDDAQQKPPDEPRQKPPDEPRQKPPDEPQTTAPATVWARFWGNRTPGQVFKPMATGFLKLLVVLVVLAIVYGVFALTVRYGKDHADTKSVTTASYLFAFEALFIVGIVVWLACRTTSPPGLQFLYMGDDKRTSTSKIQYLIWTVGVAFALAYVSGHTLMTGNAFECDATAGNGSAVNCIPGGSIWEQYIILLGVPAAAAVVAKGIVSYKVNNGTLQKVQNSESAGFSINDVVGNDDGTPSLYDSQYLIFNVIAFLYVAVNFVQRGTLVNVPAMLLGLTSTAAGVYTLNKTLLANPPQVQNVTPNKVAPGTGVKIKGNNLMPSGSSGADNVVVTIGGAAASDVKQLDANTITATAPYGMNAQDANLTVTTAANVTTEPYPLTILAGPTIVAWTAPPVRGTPAILLVSGLPDDLGQHVLQVIVNGIATAAQFTAPNNVTFPLDNTVQRGPVNLQLLIDGIPSATATLTVP
jgi:hypothetical protein